MIPPNVHGVESSGDSPELDTPVPDPQQPTVPVELRVDKIETQMFKMDKEMSCIRVLLEQIVRGQNQQAMAFNNEAMSQGLASPVVGVLPVSHATPPGFSSPVAGGHLAAPPSPVNFPTFSSLPSPRPTYTVPQLLEPRSRPLDTRFSGQTFEHRLEPPRGLPDLSTKPIDLPMFEGRNPEDWLFRMEKCFTMNRTAESEKLERALTCLTGSAVTWWRVAHEREKILTWSTFKEKFTVRFKQSRGSSTLDQLLNIS